MPEQIHPKKRDNSLDLLRGLAALSIIFIHTTFWSGEAYVPRKLESLSLILDVPFFFFLTGWGAGYVRSLKKSLLSLVRIYLKYLVFFCMYVLLLLVMRAVWGWDNGLTASNLLGNLVFRIGAGTALPVVMGSIWFMPVYFVVLPLGSLILWLAARLSGGDEGKLSRWTTLALALTLLALCCTWAGLRIPLLNQTRLFYLSFYLLGLLSRRVTIPRLSWTAGLIVLDLAAMVLLGRLLDLNFFLMQDMKFPPNAVYFLFSLVTVIAALWLRGKLSGVSPSNPLCRIGRAALLFYFCQGIGSSVLQRVMPLVNHAWYWKLPLAYVINLSVTMAFVWLLSKLYWAVFQLIPEKVGARRERV